MKLDFKDIQDTRGGECYVLGLGPSLNRHWDKLVNVPSDRIITCNDMDQLSSLKFDYWVIAQPADEGNPASVQNAYNRYNTSKVLFYTDCLDTTKTPDELLTCDYIGYDQRHFKQEPCGPRMRCCDGIQDRLTIQEEFQKYCGADDHYGAGDTVAVHMLSIAVMLGFREIYITGVDLDYTEGYFNNPPINKDFPYWSIDQRKRMGMSSINRTPMMVERIIEDMKIIRDSAKLVGANIYSLDNNLKINEVFKTK